MTFGEDASRNRLNDTPENMALIKYVVLNQLQAAKPHFKKRTSIKGLRKSAGWKDAVLDEIFNGMALLVGEVKDILSLLPLTDVFITGFCITVVAKAKRLLFIMNFLCL